MQHTPITVGTKIIGHVRHFWWLGPNVWWEILQFCIDHIKSIGQMSDEPWRFFGNTAVITTTVCTMHLLKWKAIALIITIIYRIIYGLPWIAMFLVTSGVIRNNFHEWCSHEWPKTPYSRQPIYHFISYRGTWISGPKTRRNQWKLPSINQRDLVYGGSVDCGIVTSCKYILRRHFDQLSSEHF